jgi:chromosome segregation ATPase
MKKTLSVVLAASVLSLVCLMPIAFGQTETTTGGGTVSALLDKELTELGTVLDSLEAFMAQLVGEVKGNMAEIGRVEGKADDLRDVLRAVSVEIKDAEGKIVGLREDVDRLAGVSEESKTRITALEAGLAELSKFCEKLATTLEVTRDDVAKLSTELAALLDELRTLKVGFAALGEELRAGLAALASEVRIELDAMSGEFRADISALKKTTDDLSIRVQKLEDEDVATFKKKVIELERAMSALAIKVDNNRAKLEGFDQALATLAASVEQNTLAIGMIQPLVESHETRLAVLEDPTSMTELKNQVNTLFVISILALLAGVGALLWGFMGQ